MFSVAIELGGSGGLRHHRPLPVTPSLRGYAGKGSQLHASGTGKHVSITGLAARFCPTGRDLFLERRVGVDTPSWERSVLGHVVDDVLVKLHQRGLELMEDAFEAATVSHRQPDLSQLEEALRAEGSLIASKVLADWTYAGPRPELKGMAIDEFADKFGGRGGDLVDKTQSALTDLVRHEAHCLHSYLRRRRLARLYVGRMWMAEARATIARLQTGQRLGTKEDTQLFGVSENVAPDFLYAVTLIGDVKTGEYHAFYETVATGYAIFAEHVLNRRINTAAILAVSLDLERGSLRAHGVKIVTPDNEKRQLWVTQRDMALSVIRGPGAPAHPEDLQRCQPCPYSNHCWATGVPGIDPVTPEPVRARSR